MLKQFQNEILLLRAQLEKHNNDTGIELIKSEEKVKKSKANSNMIDNVHSDEECKEEPEELVEIQKAKYVIIII